MYKLKLNENQHTIPTIGFNVETVEYKNISFTIWDVGGQDKIRPLWCHYYEGTDAVIFVVDSNDRERIVDHGDYGVSAKEELHRLLASDQLRNAAVLVLANKQDLPNALSTDEVVNRLEMSKIRNHNWFVQATSAKSGDGLWEGLDWLSKQVTKS